VLSKPAQRSLKHLRDNGWTVVIVEKWIPVAGDWKRGKRVDVWGFGDLLACRPALAYTCNSCGGTGIVLTGRLQGRERPSCKDCNGLGEQVIPARIALVQTTAASSFAAHRAKLLAIPELYIWKSSGGKVFLHGWRFGGARGERKHWILKEEEL
jgi:hypothetical protein